MARFNSSCSTLLARWTVVKGSVAATILSVVMAGAFTAPAAHATEWRVCNASGEDATVAIAFSLNDTRQYISKGWWNIPGNGGCKVVFNGNLPVIGTFLHAEGKNGGSWGGRNLFCTSSTRFEQAHANVDDRTCRARGGQMKAFDMHRLDKSQFTTTLRNSSANAHGFGNDVVAIPADR